MSIIAVFMIAVWFTIAYEKPHALVFAGVIVAIGMSARWVTHHREAISGTVSSLVGLNLKTSSAAIEVPTTSTTRFLVATQGAPKLVAFALEQAKSFHAEVLFLFVRHIAVPMIGPAHRPDIANDPDAQRIAKEIQEKGAAAGVPVRFLYTVADNISETIVDFAVTYGVSQVILDTKCAPRRTMKGDATRRCTTSAGTDAPRFMWRADACARAKS